MENICFVVNKYPNEFEPYMLVFLQQLAWEFADMGKKVTVICPLPVNLNRKYLQIPYHTREYTEKKKSIDIYWPKTAGLGQSHYVLGRSPVGITTFFLEKAAERVIRSFTEKPDVIYGHFMAPSGIAVARLSDTFKIPAFFALGESHNTIEQFGAERAKEELKDIAGVIAVSTYLKRWIVDAGVLEDDKVEVFPNGINGDRFRKYNKTYARDYFGLPKNEVLVGFVGAFNERKGILRVCEAMKTVRGARLICAGKGEQSPYGDNCIFAKSLKPEEIPLFNSAADIFVLPTLNEGCSNAIVEAMACGLPIISSNRAFNDDILDAECSIRVNPVDVDEIHEAIQKLVSDPISREKMSEAAIKKAENLTLSVRAQNILAYIENRIVVWESENTDRNRRKKF